MSVHDTVPVRTAAPGAPAAPLIPVPAITTAADRRETGPPQGAQHASRSKGAARRSRARVSVDNTHCELYGICEQEAPEVFALAVDGRLRYTARPAAKHLAGVRQAARCCPMQAITVTEPR